MDERVEAFLANVLALEGEEANTIRQGVRGALADYEQLFRAQEVNKRMKEKAAHACHALCRARVVEEIRLRKGTPTAEHLRLVLSVINAGRIIHERTDAGDIMAERSDSLELRIAFHNAVSRFQDWTTGVTEPRVKYCGRFCAISEVCQEVGNLSDRPPGDLLAILRKETHTGNDALALKMDETYRRAGRFLLRLIEKRKDEMRRRNALQS
jgi:hypothetical protein